MLSPIGITWIARHGLILSTKKVNDIITESDLAFAVDDPASKVDIEKEKYIPMSGRKEASITAGKAYTITCGLDRLVSKVKLSITGDAEVDVPLKTFTFTGTADKVDLYDDVSSGETILYNGKASFVGEEGMTLTTGVTKEFVFYVNESDQSNSSSDGFTIDLATTETDDYAKYDGVTYTATTARLDIPRNSIYPVSLTIDSYDFSVVVTTWGAPIGLYETLYYNDDKYNKSYPYLITIRDFTSRVTIEPILENTGTEEEVTNVEWTWTYDNEDEGSMSWNEDTKLLTFTQLTAVAGYEYVFTVTARWKTTSEDGGTSTSTRTYNLDLQMSTGSYYILVG